MIPQDRISPIARRLLRSFPQPNIAGAPLGQPNFQKAQTREKTTDGFDAKMNYTLSAKDQLSYRVSFMRPVVFDPGPFGDYGGPANGGFAGTGTNKSISTAVDLDAHVHQHPAARRPRRPELLPQRRDRAGRRPQHEHRRRHPGREPRRRTPAASRRSTSAATRDPRARVLAEPAVGPLREDVERRDDADASEGRRTR